MPGHFPACTDMLGQAKSQADPQQSPLSSQLQPLLQGRALFFCPPLLQTSLPMKFPYWCIYTIRTPLPLCRGLQEEAGRKKRGRQAAGGNLRAAVSDISWAASPPAPATLVVQSEEFGHLLPTNPLHRLIPPLQPPSCSTQPLTVTPPGSSQPHTLFWGVCSTLLCSLLPCMGADRKKFPTHCSGTAVYAP